MKKFTLLLVLFVTSLASAQLKTSEVKDPVEIGKVAPMGKTQILISQYPDNYLFLYRDMDYPNIDEYKSFIILNTEFEDLYALIAKSFEDKKEGEIKVELQMNTIYIKTVKSLGIVNVQISHDVTKSGSVAGRTQFITKKQLDKLFGKKK
ncbi:hypothetical protein [Flavobacterium subsaxonicum]|uniref:Uncharacterized protein n=1 Tax=Flavobacterium subsaxonicum WB 4.1-42 = DSM 21790 TaxID=1121898 RepID=A0A0A2MR98_9FLAO|nr:hypothetical protein [Flavobacterium subsaxonicum]KGO94101.1 hypothetical protein Q766_03980 [Flavobacterium subsaxonicum WB 4.1-42 = DSM 21790]